MAATAEAAPELKRLGACPGIGALRGERRGQRRFEIQMVNFEKFHAAKQPQARLRCEPNPAPGLNLSRISGSIRRAST